MVALNPQTPGGNGFAHTAETYSLREELRDLRKENHNLARRLANTPLWAGYAVLRDIGMALTLALLIVMVARLTVQTAPMQTSAPSSRQTQHHVPEPGPVPPMPPALP